MGTPDLEKICNIAGYPIYKWTVDQLNVRTRKGSLEPRPDDNLLYQANKGAWIRVISSVDLNKGLEGKLTKHIAQLVGVTGVSVNRDNLAKNFILYGGTSTWAESSMNLRYGTDVGGSYNLLGKGELMEFGYTPMPGITRATVETIGNMGVLKQATINFKVFDKHQLDLMDVLYFRVGYTLIVEWGHAKYYNNKGELKSSENYMIDPFKETCKTPEDILIQINTATQQSDGNYGGMFGVITNFDFSYGKDGSYDCTVKVLSLGALFGNMPINRPSILSKVYENQLNKVLNNEADKRINEERIKLEKRQAEEAKKAKAALNIDEWAYLLDLDKGQMDAPLEGDPIATLIHNTGNIKVGGYRGRPEAEAVVTLESAKKLDTVRQEVSKYKSNHNIVYSSFLVEEGDFKNLYYRLTLVPPTNTGISNIGAQPKIYYIEDRANFGPIIYFESLNGYIVGKTNTDGSYVKLNLGGEQSVNYILQSKNDDLNEADGLVGSVQTSYVKYGNKSNSIQQFKNDFDTEDKDVYYSIKLKYPEGKKENAKKVFTNPETRYQVISIQDVIKTGTADYRAHIYSILLKVVNEDGMYVELGAEKKGKVFLGEDTTSWYSLPDLSLITSIEPPPLDNDLTKNKTIEAYNKAVAESKKKALGDLITLGEDVEFDILQTKRTLESASAIELMLKSVLLWGITNDLTKVTSKDKVEFIKQLYSQGAYSKFFSNGYPAGVITKDIFNKYLSGNLTKDKRLLMNLLYGNNYQLLSCENVYDSNGTEKKLYDIIPKVNFEELTKITTVNYGESPQLGSNKLFQTSEFKKSVYIKLGHFLLMLNHAATLYILDDKDSVITPTSYIDFNPSTNFYLSSKNHISTDPYKFLIGYYGEQEDYKKLFDKSLLDGDKIKIVAEQTSPDSNAVVKLSATAPKLFNPGTDDQLTYLLPKTQKKNLGGEENNAYVGRLMDVEININYLLKMIKQYASSNNSHEVYFQTVIERILDDLFKSLGSYNAFSLFYNHNSNCYHIVDQQIQPADPNLISEHTSIIAGKSSYEIPIFFDNNKSSVVRSLEIRTDISNRISSMVAIAANPTTETQVGLGRDSSDFGVYNLGTEDRYKKLTGDSNKIGPNKDVKDNGQMAMIAATFNDTVKKIYSTFFGLDEKERVPLSQEEIDTATNYYTERMSYVKNQQSGSVHSLIIPIKSSVTVDGISSLYPFQLYTLPEIVMPYRYSVGNLGKKVAYSISKVVHTFDKNEWVTQFDGFMTLLKEADYYKSEQNVRKITKPTPPTTPTTNGKFYAKDTSDRAPIINTLIRKFKQAGYSDFAVAALIGGFKAENETLSPTAKNPSRAYGLAQWLNPRLEKLQAKRGFDTIATQVQFIIDELNGEEKFSGSKLKTSTTLAEAIAAAVTYERFKDVSNLITENGNSKSKAYNIILDQLNAGLQPTYGEWRERIAYAQDIYDKIQSGVYK